MTAIEELPQVAALRAELGEQPSLTCADLAKVTGRSPELFRRLAAAGRLKAYRDVKGVKCPYRFKKSDFVAFWDAFQKEAHPWQGITSSAKRTSTAKSMVRGGRVNRERDSQLSTKTAKQRISELRRDALIRGLKS